MTGNLPPAGTVFLIAPKPQATTTARELHEMLAEWFPGTGLGITGMQPGSDAQPRSDGSYEVQVFGTAGAEALRMVARYCFWRIVNDPQDLN